MRTLHNLINTTLVLGMLSVIALALQYLALSDIAKQEADVTLEWRIVGIGMSVVLSFVVSTFAMIVVFLKRMPSITPDARRTTAA